MTTALLGFLAGARAIGGLDPPASATVDAGVREKDRLHGGFWRPAGSNAERPTLSLAPVTWTPSASMAHRPQPDPIASVQAVVRLASLE